MLKAVWYLCDVLTYVERFRTGSRHYDGDANRACVIALGHHITGLMSNHNRWRELIGARPSKRGDRAWRLPLGDEVREQLSPTLRIWRYIGGRLRRRHHRGLLPVALYP